MPGRKGRNSEKDKERQGGVEKGWHLIQNYRREDPERHIAEPDFTDSAEETANRFEVPSLLRAEMTTYQTEVVGWLEFAITSWFNFYFALGDGSPEDRLAEVSEDLAKSTERLETIAGQMGNLLWNDSQWHDLILIYAQAVNDWAAALDLVMRGAKFDRHNLAEEGFERLNAGSATAERVVRINAIHESGVNVAGALRTLDRLKPEGRVSYKTVAQAKQPWERALIAAGSRFTWSKAVW